MREDDDVAEAGVSRVHAVPGHDLPDGLHAFLVAAGFTLGEVAVFVDGMPTDQVVGDALEFDLRTFSDAQVAQEEIGVHVFTSWCP